MAPRTLMAGDLVTYVHRTTYGTGIIREIEPSGLVRVDFEILGEFVSDTFHVLELERVNDLKAAA